MEVENMVRVLHVFANLNLGGAESRIIDVYKKVDRSKVQFDFLILTDDDCYFERQILHLGGRIFRVKHPRLGMYRHLKDLANVLRSNRFHAVHSHTSYYSGLVMAMAWCFGVKYRVSHARNQVFAPGSWKVTAMFLVGRLLCRFFSTSRLAISKPAGLFLFGKNADFDVIPNAFDFESVLPRAGIGFAKGLDSGALKIVMVARFSKVKNHHFALHVLSDLVRNYDENVTLDLIGSGDQEVEIRNLVASLKLENNVRFLGKRDDVKELLCKFHCLILPSFSEGLGVAALEAQAACLPCIVSEGVPAEVDIGMGLCRREPLVIERWVCVLKSLKSFPRVSKSEVDARLRFLGYSLERTSSIYLEKYGIQQ
ncbi:glycosyltransferase [Thauera phenolivorans]|uniref:glycosyltransferase n=1 Tax=Thauera phenolivorans TaxID=1792543 RepID=UPI0018E3E5D1|nr:glycosyltransferase [Thauera phenolivorans]